ncbi:High-copy suppressor of rspA [Dermatophilus congolensis]|uniref:High-copy suppressor of rspA n=1 Tax=Dermatophilus congolensis TaxID=1863 RepID=A0A239VQW2_9MICO|nr:MFS transporter [Dermatophilus congolensis]SNV24229.1 High-copy suppressor of rspA [Dermatophilus congolensis]
MTQRTHDTFSNEQKHVLAILLIPAFMSLLSVSIINVTLPAISGSLHTGTSGLQWVISGYALVFGVLLVPAGRAGDVWGRGKLFTTGLVTFGLGSLLSGLAPNIIMLNLARVVMGIGSGLLNPQVTGMIQQYFNGHARGRAFGAFGGIIGVSVAIGPVLGGTLIALLGSAAGWRCAFLVNVPIAFAGAIAARKLLPPTAWAAHPDNYPTATKEKADFDPIGMILLALATTCIMVPFMEAALVGPTIWVVLAIGLALVAAWLRWETNYRRRGHQPMVDLDLFTTRSFANGAMLIAVYFFGSTSVWLIIAQYMQAGLGHSAFASGMIGLPSAIAAAITAPIAGKHVVRIGRPLVLWGLGIVLIALLSTGAVALLHKHGISEWWMLLTLSFLGLGQGMVISPNQTLTLADVPVQYAGSAGGVLQTGQRIGTAIGIAVITTVAFHTATTNGWDQGLAIGMAATACTTLAAIALGTFDLIMTKRERRTTPDTR